MLNARNAVEAAVLRVRERFVDGAYKAVLAPETLMGAEQDWLDEQAGDDDGNEDEQRRGLYAARLAAFEAYVALCDEKRKQAECDRAAGRGELAPRLALVQHRRAAHQ